MADDKALPDDPVLLDDDAPDLGGTPVVTDSPRLLRRNSANCTRRPRR